MFDVGFSELLIIAVVALLVLGPERLPKAARFAGLWMRRARAQWYSVKAELERELANEELQSGLKNPLADLKPQMQALEKELRDEFTGLDPTLPRASAQEIPPESEPSKQA
jgi:sec-independent protein translocase protein TatB